MESQNSVCNTNDMRKKVFWSPIARWEKKDSEVKIEIFSYKDFVVDLFPKFYFLTQKGIEIGSLINEFKDIDSGKLMNFVNDLLKKKLIVSSILTPQEIFFPQSYIFKNEYSEKIRYDAEELKKFKDKQLNRSSEFSNATKLVLKGDGIPEYICNRKSYRTFSSDLICFDVFCTLLSSFRQIRDNNSIRYYYASAGGLYPLDIYLYVKENRVEGVAKGLYYYNPIDNSINLIDDECEITKESHYFTNQAIFGDSAVSIFIIYNAEVTMPKYGGMGYVYSFIDAGLLVGTLTAVGELNNIGVCSIGDMNFKKIEKYFKLNHNQVLIHDVELGLKPEKQEDFNFNY